eukprot:3189883-Rhodomonas_salina.6
MAERAFVSGSRIPYLSSRIPYLSSRIPYLSSPIPYLSSRIPYLSSRIPYLSTAVRVYVSPISVPRYAMRVYVYPISQYRASHSERRDCLSQYWTSVRGSDIRTGHRILNAATCEGSG